VNFELLRFLGGVLCTLPSRRDHNTCAGEYKFLIRKKTMEERKRAQSTTAESVYVCVCVCVWDMVMHGLDTKRGRRKEDEVGVDLVNVADCCLL